MPHQVASLEEWKKARIALLNKEKALTRQRDALAEERRALPWVRIEKDYVFAGPKGPAKLSDLFAGKSQLALYHFMLGPDWAEPCKSCSFWAEHFDAVRTHIAHRDVELAAASRAPLAKIEELQSRFGWRFPWWSSLDSDFNFDFGVSFTEADDGEMIYNYGSMKASKGELPGVSVFAKDENGVVFHTYSAYGRGLEPLNGTYQTLDLVPKGRDEDGLRFPMAWVRHKDRYEDA